MLCADANPFIMKAQMKKKNWHKLSTNQACKNRLVKLDYVKQKTEVN